MKSFAILLLIPVSLAAQVGSLDGAADHPIESVIKMLKELRIKVREEGYAEADTFAKFQGWCEKSSETLGKAVQESKDSIDTLSDTVESKKKEKADTEEKIKFLEEEMTKYDTEETQAKKDREEANKAYKAADKDFDSTIKAVGEAVKALKASKKSAFLQFTKPDTPREDQALRQLLQQPLVLEQLSDAQQAALTSAVFGGPVTEADILAKEKYAEAGNTYTFKSGNIIELLEGLKTHFENEKKEATNAETASANDYDMAKSARKDALAAAKKAKADKTTLLGEVEKDLNTAESDLKDEKDELKADSKTLEDTKTTCQIKHDEFEERSTLRKHEMEAMEAAIEIMAEVSGVQHKKPKTDKLPNAPGGKFLFLQLAQSNNADPKMKAINLIKEEAKKVHSSALRQFAEQLTAKADDPFAELDNMIQKMIFRLMDEQTKEDTHKQWCDLELETSKTSKESKADKVKSLAAKIKDAKATVDELTIKIKDLDEKVVKITEFMKKATEIRNKGKEENKLAIKDAEDAQAAIAKAQAVLTSFYKESGMIEKKPWEFIQEPEPVKLPKEPKSWGSSYTGVTDPTKADTGVIAVLKATAADFSKMEADTRAQEASDQSQFEGDMKDSAIDKAKNMKESEMKSDQKKRTLDSINSMTKQKKHTENELGAVKQYLKDLEPACVKGDSSYEDRKKARTDEIEALGKAQGILKDAFEESLVQINRH